MADREQNRESIMLAAIEMIERVGLASVTVRAVAQQANVNVAAISYYFGSKAKLIELVLAQTLSHMFADIEEMLTQLDSQPRLAATKVLSYLLEGALRYPNITRAHLHEAFTSAAADARHDGLPEAMAPLVLALTRSICKEAGLVRERALHRAVQALSAVLFPSFFQGFFAPSPARALVSAKARGRYIAEVVASAYHPR